jgi:hypothetical protein
MNRGAQTVLAAFDELPAPERDEVLSELLRRVAFSEHEAPSDEELVAAADHVFQGLDRQENSGR